MYQWWKARFTVGISATNFKRLTTTFPNPPMHCYRYPTLFYPIFSDHHNSQQWQIVIDNRPLYLYPTYFQWQRYRWEILKVLDSWRPRYTFYTGFGNSWDMRRKYKNLSSFGRWNMGFTILELKSAIQSPHLVSKHIDSICKKIFADLYSLSSTFIIDMFCCKWHYVKGYLQL